MNAKQVMELTAWILTAMSMIGSVLNMCKLRSGQGVWIFSNAGWIAIFYLAGNKPTTALFTFYLATSIFGFFWWKHGARDSARRNHNMDGGIHG